MHAGFPERLIGVQVADAGQERLVEQQRLDPPFSSAQLRHQQRFVQIDERVGSELGGEEVVQLDKRSEQVDAPELARVDEAQQRAIVKLDLQVGVRFGQGIGGSQKDVAAHFAVNDQPLVWVELNEQVFATAIDDIHDQAR